MTGANSKVMCDAKMWGSFSLESTTSDRGVSKMAQLVASCSPESEVDGESSEWPRLYVAVACLAEVYWQDS